MSSPAPEHYSSYPFDLLSVKQEFQSLMTATTREKVNAANSLNPHLLFDFRDKINRLLSAGNLSGEDRQALEQMKKEAHPLVRIAQLYRYQPDEEGGKINLDIQWGMMNINDSFEEMSDLFDGISTTSLGGYLSADAKLKSIQLGAHPIDLDLHISGGLTAGNQKLLKISLRHPFRYDNPFLGPVADFDFVYSYTDDAEIWNMRHRLVSPEFRSQGIATQLIQLMEDFLRYRQSSTQKAQKITAEIAQVDVLFSLLRNNKFRPASTSDELKIDRLWTGDESLMLTSSSVDVYLCGPLHWFVFEKDKWQLHKNDPYLWCSWPQESKPHYTKDAFMISLEKEIT